MCMYKILLEIYENVNHLIYIKFIKLIYKLILLLYLSTRVNYLQLITLKIYNKCYQRYLL